jgi:vacuolar-type H+-ATPase subunit I/STV1
MSRVISPMIAGPSNFPVRQMEKRNNTLDKRREELLEWRKKALNRLNRTYNPAILAKAPIRSDEPDAIEQLQAKIDAAEKDQAAMKAVNKIVRSKLDDDQKITKIIALGLSEELLKIFRQAGGKFPAYRLTNNNANIKRMKARIAILKAEDARPEVEDRKADIEGTPVTIVENRDEGRLQLLFEGKPPKEVRKKLKINGFKWAPSQEALPRLLNNNARQVVENLIKEIK